MARCRRTSPASFAPGDELELRGPIGGYFVWEQSLGGPLVLLAGGSGIVPLRAMLRHHAATKSTVPVRLLYSARRLPDVIYQSELTQLGEEAGVDIRFTLTREQPAAWRGYARRIDQGCWRRSSGRRSEQPLVYVCGPTPFVETAAGTLVSLGHEAARIKTERFGPTGGASR